MPFTAKDFHTFAIWLAEQKSDEASLRTAISRAYYAGYHLAAQRMQTKGWEPKGKGDDHGSLIAAMRRGGRTKQLGDILYDLLEFRRHADYHLEAAATVSNDYCSHCKKIRESSSPADSVVNSHHWGKVHEICQRLLPRLDRL